MSGITVQEFEELAKFVSEKHSLRNGGRRIKYIGCRFDTRTGTIFNVSFDDKIFAIVNENRKRNLKKWLYCYLNYEDDGFDPVRDDPGIDWGSLIKKRNQS